MNASSAVTLGVPADVVRLRLRREAMDVTDGVAVGNDEQFLHGEIDRATALRRIVESTRQ